MEKQNKITQFYKAVKEKKEAEEKIAKIMADLKTDDPDMLWSHDKTSMIKRTEILLCSYDWYPGHHAIGHQHYDVLITLDDEDIQYFKRKYGKQIRQEYNERKKELEQEYNYLKDD